MQPLLYLNLILGLLVNRMVIWRRGSLGAYALGRSYARFSWTYDVLLLVARGSPDELC